MRRVVASITMTAVATAALAAGTAAGATNKAAERAPGLTSAVGAVADHVPGEVLVRYKKGLQGAERSAVRSAAGAKVESNIPAFRTQLLDLPANASVQATIARLNADPRVAFAEPNYTIQVEYTPNDPMFTNLWGFNNTGQQHGISYADPAGTTRAGTSDADGDVVEAWDTEKGDAGTVIAVIDSGIDVTHPDLDANLWTNSAELNGAAGVDDDSNGWVDDVHGYDTADNDASLLGDPSIEGYEHGTHVAGTIAAEGDNSAGVVGVCPSCQVMAIKFMKGIEVPDGAGGTKLVMSGNTSDELEAIAYAKKNGADIINGSYGSFGYSQSQRKALASLKTSNILGVFAAANSAGDNDLPVANEGQAISPAYPASYNLPGIMSVAASTDEDRIGYHTACDDWVGYERWHCAFSNYGEQAVDLAAPGVDTLSTMPGGGYAYFNGTSMASPFTAGVAGLVRSHKPTLTALQIKNALMRGVDKPATLQMLDTFIIQGNDWPGKWLRTSGRLNADKALDAGTANFPVTDGNIDGAITVNGVMSGSVIWGGDANDVYKKKLVKGTKYKVVLNGAEGETYGCCSLDLHVYAPGTKEIHDWSKSIGSGFVADSNDEKVTFVAGKDGTHFFQVQAFLSDKFTYKLSVVKV